MGGWDVNCAICGAGFSVYDSFAEDGGEEDGYDRELLGGGDLEWLEKARVIGFNPEAFSVRKCFITGKGNAHDYGRIECSLGDDHNVPQPSPTHHGKVGLTVYSNYDPNEPLAVPFHEDCFVLLSKAIYYSLHGNIPPNLGKGEKITGEGDEVLGFVSKDVLYAAMKKLYVTDSYDHCLSEVDYAELNVTTREQYWGCIRGEEAWVSNPLTSEQLTYFFSHTAQTLGLNSSPPTTRSSTTTCNPIPHNPFSNLPKELISEILLYLPLSSLKSFALSGLIPFRLEHNLAFWRRKTNLDFAFLYDLPNLEGERNWLAVYQELHRQCHTTTPEKYTDDEGEERIVRERDQSLVLGLANRRRVWGICEQIVSVYLECLKSLMDDDGDEEKVDVEVVEKSLSLQLPIVGNPLSSDGKSISTFFISSWAELSKELVLAFFFEGRSKEARLRGVEAQGKRLFGELGGRIAEVAVEDGARIDGLVLSIVGGSENALKDATMGIAGIELMLDNGTSLKVGEQTGDKRLLKVNGGMVATGLIGELGNGIITRLGLLQAPDPRSTSFIPPSKAVSPTLKPLWHTSLPPQHIHASPYQTGYWTPSRSYDTTPMSFILFSPDGTYDQLSSLRGIESDPNMRCWGVSYNIEEGKRTGPRDKMDEVKMFKVDGEEGERVVKVEVGMNSLVQGIKVLFLTPSHSQLNLSSFSK
ncbi:uncharacterized protein LY89DRAFT_156806 [Mollisia scopiformis]|uniref:F-box domain-containing protein n=1 Tax=Mollisia scopiformis TaxID=149040 RepID=A0A194WZE3_MOLSC|nr:uncharacterized protein LY89DRAFT_156806 [Mollisia scopiformis]KUJ13318.1 hypothetical protein LY89DRAFT_156806 [Mollisia scopiformis]